MTAQSPPLPLEIPSYHRAMAGLLRREEPGVWRWLEGAQTRAEHYNACRLNLLKTTVRLDPEGQPELHATLRELLEKLEQRVPATLYQSQADSLGSGLSNAGLLYVPGEVHIIFSGPLLSLLDPTEIRAVLAHELAHFVLLECDGGTYQTASRLIDMSADHPAARNVHLNSARAWSLQTEIFADRVALQLTGDLHICVSSLVKIHTGVPQVHAAGYLRQAEEIFEGSAVQSQGLTHPELFIRARALQLFAAQGPGCEAAVSGLVKSGQDLDGLDWLDQDGLTAVTRRFWLQLLSPSWLRTPALVAHARLFFPDLVWPAPADAEIWAEIKNLAPALREYFLWLLGDVIAVERELEDMPTAVALWVATQLDLETEMEQLLKREFKITARDLKKLKKNAPAMIAAAGAAP